MSEYLIIVSVYFYSSLKRHLNRCQSSSLLHRCTHSACGHAFSTSTALLAHVNAIHNIKGHYYCNTCHRSYGTTESLHRHIFRCRTRKGNKTKKVTADGLSVSRLTRLTSRFPKTKVDSSSPQIITATEACSICGHPIKDK